MIDNAVSQHKILAKLGEVPIRLDLVSGAKLSPFVGLSILRERSDRRSFL